MKKIAVMFLLMSTINCFAQDIQFFEESEVTESRIPQLVKNQINTNFPNEDVKWFLTYINDGIAYCAKFKIQKQLLSIKFNSEGTYYDVEVPIKWKELENNTQQILNKYFAENYEHFKVRKLHNQYKQNLNEVASYFYGSISKLTPSYVIEFTGKEKVNFRTHYKAEFDNRGEFVSKQAISIPEADFRHFDN